MGRRRTVGLVLVGSTIVAAGCNALNGANDLGFECSSDCTGDAATTTDAADANTSADAPAPDADAGFDASVMNDGGADADAAVPFCNPADPGLILCLPFDGNVMDLSATPFPSALINNVTFGPGRVGQGANFATGSVVFAHAPKLDVDAVTLEAFIKPNTLPLGAERKCIVDSGGRFGFFLVAGGVQCFAGSASGNVLLAGTVPIGSVSHVACTAGASGMTMYIDGVVKGTAPLAAALVKNTSILSIGQNDPSGDNFDGMIDELRIYARVRSASEIAAAAARSK